MQREEKRTQSEPQAAPHRIDGSTPGVPPAAPPPQASSFTFDRIVRFVGGMLVLAVVGWLLWMFAGLVMYLLIGVLMAYLMQPVVDRLQGIGLGRIPSILTTFILVFGGIGVLLTFLVPFLGRQVSDLSQQIAIKSAVQITAVLPSTPAGRAGLEVGDFIVQADSVMIREVDQLQALLRDRREGDQISLVVRDPNGNNRLRNLTIGQAEEIVEGPGGQRQAAVEGRVLEPLGLGVRTVMFSDVVTAFEDAISRIVPVQEGIVVDAVAGVFETLFREDRLTRIMGSVVNFFTNVIYALVIIPFVAFFVLKDGGHIRHRLLQPVPNRYFEITLSIIEKVESNIGRYFRGLLVQCLSIAALATVLLSIAGLHSALAVGLFAGLANTIPYFGPLMGFIAGTVVGTAQTGDLSLVPGVLIAMGLTQLADNIFFQPIIFSRAASAHPLIILFVVLIGAQLAGIIGMLVAIPLTTVIRVVVREVRWSLRNYRILQAS